MFAALDDTWAFDLSSGRWLELAARLPHGFARSRAALAVSRDRLLLAGGCRARYDLPTSPHISPYLLLAYLAGGCRAWPAALLATSLPRSPRP